MLEIRTFVEADRTEVLDVARRAGQGAPTESLWGHQASELAVYLTPYLDHTPDTVFLPVVDGKIVGYLAGCPDLSLIPSEEERIERAIREYRLFGKPRLLGFFARAFIDTLRAKATGADGAGELDDACFPAHLHINVAPEARGTGAAEAAMRAWQSYLTEHTIRGCYLQTTVENLRAVRFFRRMGFEPHGATPAIPGVRHAGKRTHQRTMVWSTH